MMRQGAIATGTPWCDGHSRPPRRRAGLMMPAWMRERTPRVRSVASPGPGAGGNPACSRH
ncbi:protein of unknown function [Rhodovastum atsumiense]|nr:protein of unknown function [Rhodovastum atsumiense]